MSGSVDIRGKYKLKSSEKFDEFLKAIGVGMMMRSIAKTQSPVMEFKHDGDNWEIATTTTFKNEVLKFTLGKEFEEERLDGAKVKTTVTLDNGKLVQTQKAEDGKTLAITYEPVDKDTLKVVCTVDDVASTRIYTRQ